MRVFNLILNDPKLGNEMVGTVEFTEERLLKILTIRPGKEEYLRSLVEGINSKKVIHIDVAPPPGAVRFSRYSNPIERHDPMFFDALKSYLKLYYGLEFVDATPD